MGLADSETSAARTIIADAGAALDLSAVLLAPPQPAMLIAAATMVSPTTVRLGTATDEYRSLNPVSHPLIRNTPPMRTVVRRVLLLAVSAIPPATKSIPSSTNRTVSPMHSRRLRNQEAPGSISFVVFERFGTLTSDGS
jgi:hypothetical protein